MMDKAAFEANNGVIVQDPMTGELRMAGQFASNEWRKLATANPDLATALIKLRQSESDKINAQQSRRQVLSMAGAGLVARPIMNRFGHTYTLGATADLLKAHENTMVPKGTTIYESPDSRLYAKEAGMIEFEPVGSRTIPERDLVRAKTAFQNFKQSPEGRKLYVATPGHGDEVRKGEIYQKLGFTRTPEGILRLDKRPGADEFGGLYRLGDRTAYVMKTNPDMVRRIVKTGGTIGATLAGATLLRAGWGLINPLEDV
jgi:hypothetical protein